MPIILPIKGRGAVSLGIYISQTISIHRMGVRGKASENIGSSGSQSSSGFRTLAVIHVIQHAMFHIFVKKRGPLSVSEPFTY